MVAFMLYTTVACALVVVIAGTIALVNTVSHVIARPIPRRAIVARYWQAGLLLLEGVCLALTPYFNGMSVALLAIALVVAVGSIVWMRQRIRVSQRATANIVGRTRPQTTDIRQFFADLALYVVITLLALAAVVVAVA